MSGIFRKPNSASVTAIACGCGFLDREVTDEASPFVFSDRTNEYGARATTPGGSSVCRIYHCPFCGGGLPPSRRPQLLDPTRPEEVRGLRAVAATLRGLDSAAAERLPSPERRLQRANELSNIGRSFAGSDLNGAVEAYLAARQQLVAIGFHMGAATMVMEAVSAARHHDARELAIRLCHLAIRDDSAWAVPFSTLAHVETEVANQWAEQDETPRALLWYGRAARHHRRAAKLLDVEAPGEAEAERAFESFVRTRRAALVARAKRREDAP